MNHFNFAIPFGISTCSSLATSQRLREKTLPFTKTLYKYLKISPSSYHQIVPNCFPQDELIIPKFFVWVEFFEGCTKQNKQHLIREIQPLNQWPHGHPPQTRFGTPCGGWLPGDCASLQVGCPGATRSEPHRISLTDWPVVLGWIFGVRLGWLEQTQIVGN